MAAVERVTPNRIPWWKRADQGPMVRMVGGMAGVDPGRLRFHRFPLDHQGSTPWPLAQPDRDISADVCNCRRVVFR